MSEVKPNRRKRIALVVVGVIVFGAASALGVYRFAPRTAPSGQPPLTHLNSENFGQLKAAFNAAKGEVRVIALLSTT
jgi:hypothetical protein